MEQAGDVSSTNQCEEMDPMQAAAIALVQIRNFLSHTVDVITVNEAADVVENYLNEQGIVDEAGDTIPYDAAEMNALLDSDDDDHVGEDALNKDQGSEASHCQEKTAETVVQNGNEETVFHYMFANEEQKMELDEGVWLRKPQGKQPENEEANGEKAKEALIEQEGREHEHALPEEPRETPQEQARDDEDDEFPCQLRCLAAQTKGRNARNNTDDDVVFVDEIPIKTEKCDICGRESKSLKHHYGLFHPKKRYNPLISCPICGRTKIHKNSLSRHLLMHKGPRTMRCVLCPAIFAKHGHLLEHMELEHQKDG